MKKEKFNEELEKINTGSWGYGNEILYLMAQNPLDLNDKDKLSGAIWLIGRAYAASPQRRSYDVTENKEGYVNSLGKTPNKRPIWPVRTQNDGREGFFDEIAGAMKDHIEKDTAFQKFINDYFAKPFAYEYNCSDADIQKLTESILTVLKYNLFLSEALEKFDEVPAGHVFKNDNVYCSNHISFSSKFLHFYFPRRVFIIDTFARDGGKCLFNGNETNKLRSFYDAPQSVSDIFENEIYALFSKKAMSSIYEKITDDSSIQTITKRYAERLRSTITLSGDNFTIKDYIEHCIRSYLLGCYIIKDTKIVPINQIRYNTSYSVNSLPRLTDAIFLNIKAPVSTALINHYKSIKRIYKVKYIKI